MTAVLSLTGGINHEIFKSNSTNKLNKIHICKLYITYNTEVVYILQWNIL